MVGIGKDRKDSFLADLTVEFKGEWSSSSLTTGIYATDASHYQETPIVVAWPRDTKEVHTLVNLAARYKIPIVSRGAGTSLGGQTIGPGLVLDMSRYLIRILEIDQEGKWARVQPGVVRDELNAVAARYGLQFAPDPATSSRATIGGMIANNSSGTRSILYGKTIDHLISLSVMTSRGHVLELSASAKDSQDLGQEYIDKLKGILIGNEEMIRAAFPKVMRRVGGYPLDYLVNEQPMNPAQLFCGSEGTLGVILEAKVGLVPLPSCQAVCVLHFDAAREALNAVGKILPYGPSAVELLDKPVLDLGKKNPETRKLMSMINGEPGGLLFVEFSGHSPEELRQKAMALALEFDTGKYHHPVRVLGEDPDYSAPWELRKKGLGILMGTTDARKPAAFIEDSCVPVEKLPAYIDDVLEICHREGTDAIIYAHASVGVIHVRPFLDLRSDHDIAAMQRISDQVFERVVHYGGAWSGEHGDGYVRSYKNRQFFGDDVYALMLQVKQIFDPDGIMNPGKVLEAPPMTEHLRYGTAYADHELPSNPSFTFAHTGGFQSTVHMCSGVGECLKKKGGVMCPSYRATKDEMHSTRGRANALRLAMSGQLPEDLTGDGVHEALDLCLSCKACKTECPSNVDMARLKSQVNYWRFQKKGTPWRTRIFASSPFAARRLSGWSAPLVNRLMSAPFLRWPMEKILGVDAQRPLPGFSRSPLTKYGQSRSISPNGAHEVVLFADTYTAFHEDNIGRLAIKLLERLGVAVHLFSDGCCQRPAISNGVLDKARAEGEAMSERLKSFAGDRQVLVLEPGCASALKDDLPDLLENMALSSWLSENVILFEDFLASLGNIPDKEISRIKLREGNYAIHGHCHHKAVFGLEGMKNWFASYIDGDVLWLDSGCCGMAGAFGYEKEHQELSKRIAEESILKSMRNYPKRKILTTGFSCRHQIKDLSDFSVTHWLEAIEW